MHLKIVQKMNILCENCTFPVTEGNEILHLFQIMTPTRKLTQDRNFGHSQIIWHLRPANPQKPTQKDMTFEKMHSLTPAKNDHKIKKVFVFSRISYYLHLY